jgi:hypothetical protein
MPIAFKCSCGKQLAVKDELAGKAVKCPACAKVIKVPAGKAAAPSAAQPRPASGPVPAKPGQRPAAPVQKADQKPAPKPPEPPKEQSIDDMLAEPPPRSRYETAPDLGAELGPVPAAPKGKKATVAGGAEGFGVDDNNPYEKRQKKCPGCGADYYEGDIFCIKCGTNFATGKKMEAKKEARIQPGLIKFIVGVIIFIIVAVLVVFVVLPKWKKSRAAKQAAEAAADDKFKALKVNLDSGDLRGLSVLCTELNKVGDQAFPTLGEFIMNKRHPVKTKAVMGVSFLAIKGIQSADNIPILVKCFDDPELDVKVAALRALYIMASPTPEFSVLQDNFSSVETEFRDLKTKDAFAAAEEEIKKAMDNPDMNVSFEATRLAGMLGYPASVEKLIKFTEGGDVAMKQKAISKLKEITGTDGMIEYAAWTEWWEKHKGEHRLEWIVSGLNVDSQDRMSNSVGILKRVGGFVPSDSMNLGSGDGRIAAKKECENWWAAQKGNFRR